MGNLQTLLRYGKLNDTSFPPIDNLTFTYTGNQVTRIDDSGYTPTYTGAFNFVNGASQSGEYTYDQNGNLTKDLNKNISSISYNLLNLPTNITYSSGKSAAYIYDATGRKLRTSYKASASATPVPTDYCGNMIYENGVLKQILVDGGYMTVTGTPFYYYYLKDHLGSNRVVVNTGGTAIQINHYYPFGGLFGESTGNTVQRFRYNGKEFDRTHGIDWYDYGARHMTPDAGRFTTIDPMAEKYYNISPYAYCANNPINNIDIKGDSIFVMIENIGAFGFGHLGMLIQNDNGKWAYYSKDGSTEWGGLFGNPKGMKGEFVYSSPEDFFEKMTQEINRNYSEGYLIPSSREEDAKAIEAAVNEIDKTYNPLGSNCAVTVQKALESANKESGLPKNFNNAKDIDPAAAAIDVIMRGKLPTQIYNAIKKQNLGSVKKPKRR